MREIVGEWQGQIVEKVTLKNAIGNQAAILTYGATLLSYDVFDQFSNLDNIVVSPANFNDLIGNRAKWGATIGPVAGRIKNGEFTLNETTYQLEQNQGNHHLHGGSNGFDQKIFEIVYEDSAKVVLQLTVLNLADGYPGNRKITVTYALSSTGALTWRYEAESDEDTLMNMTNHLYINLSGKADSVADHHLTVNAKSVTQLLPDCIPTGELLTDAQFLKAIQNGVQLSHIFNSDDNDIKPFKGLDHGFYCGESVICELTHEASGRHLTMQSNQSAIVIYTYNWPDDANKIKDGIVAPLHCGIALETQQLPDAIHHEHFGNVILRANEKYVSITNLKVDSVQKTG